MKYNPELQYHRRYLAAEIIDNLMNEGFQREGWKTPGFGKTNTNPPIREC